MVIFIVLWPYLLATKLRCLQKNNIGHTKGGGGGGSGGHLDTTNFMRQFRDSDSLELKKLSAAQFMEVWEHYDSDGKQYSIVLAKL